MGIVVISKPSYETSPALSSIDAIPTATGCVITWTTDVASDSRVEYGEESYDSFFPVVGPNTELVSSHSVTITDGLLSSSTTYHYRVKSRDATGNLAVSGDYNFNTPSLVSSFDDLVSNSWALLPQTLPCPQLSQGAVFHDPTGDQFVSYAGHPNGGGEPTTDWTSHFDINGGAGSTWVMPYKYSKAGSTKSNASCEATFAFDPCRRLAVLLWITGIGAAGVESLRRTNLVNTDRGPLYYDPVNHVWFPSGLLGFIHPSQFSARDFDYSEQKVIYVATNNGLGSRFNKIDLSKNLLTAYGQPGSQSWWQFGFRSGVGSYRTASVLVYDDLRDRYWLFSGVNSGGIGINVEPPTWYIDADDADLDNEWTVVDHDYFLEFWVYGDIAQWTAVSANVTGDNVKAAGLDQPYGLTLTAVAADQYLYKDYTSWDHAKTYIHAFQVVTDGMTNGDATVILQHKNQTNGEIASVWLVKSGGNLYLDVQWAGGTPTTSKAISAATTYSICLETYVNASGYAKLFVDTTDYSETPAATVTGDKTALGNVDRLQIGVFSGDSGTIETLTGTLFHWNPDVNLIYPPYYVSDCCGCYDNIHDKIYILKQYTNAETLKTTGERTACEPWAKLFTFDPALNTWSVADFPAALLKGCFREGDTHAYFSEGDNAALFITTTRGSTYSGYTASNFSQNFAYRYSTTIPGGYPTRSLTPATIDEPQWVRYGYVQVNNATSVTVNWMARGDAVDGYNVYRADITAGVSFYEVGENGGIGDLQSYARACVKRITRPAWTDFSLVGYTTGTSLTDTTIANLTTPKVYAYIVKAVHGGVESGCSPFWITIPEYPTGVTSTPDGTNWDLTWTAPHDGGNGISGYRVYWREPSAYMHELTTDPITAQPYVIAAATVPASRKIFITAVDSLGQEGFPSDGAWSKPDQWESYYDDYIYSG